MAVLYFSHFNSVCSPVNPYYFLNVYLFTRFIFIYMIQLMIQSLLFEVGRVTLWLLIKQLCKWFSKSPLSTLFLDVTAFTLNLVLRGDHLSIILFIAIRVTNIVCPPLLLSFWHRVDSGRRVSRSFRYRIFTRRTFMDEFHLDKIIILKTVETEQYI